MCFRTWYQLLTIFKVIFNYCLVFSLMILNSFLQEVSRLHTISLMRLAVLVNPHPRSFTSFAFIGVNTSTKLNINLLPYRLLTVYYPVSSAYIITLSGVKHSWEHYYFHSVQLLRSTVQAVCLLPRYWTEKLFNCLIWISLIS